MRVFFHAQSLPIWRRNGPSRLTKWPGHLAHAFETHIGLIVVGAIVAVIVIAILVRFVGWTYALGAAYVFLVLGLLLGAQSPVTRIESAMAAVAFGALVLLWALGRAYLPWALFATAVLGISFVSGSVISFGREALFAFPLFWTVADGPRLLRHPLVAVAAIAANVAYALTLTKYAPAPNACIRVGANPRQFEHAGWVVGVRVDPNQPLGQAERGDDLGIARHQRDDALLLRGHAWYALVSSRALVRP